MQNYNLVFITTSGDVTVSAREHTNLLEAAQAAGVSIDAPCGGSGTCGKCRVRLREGSLSVASDALDVPTHGLTPAEEAEGWRLACQSFVEGDVTVEVPDSALAWQRGLKVEDNPREQDLAWQELVAALDLDSNKEEAFVLTLTLDPPSLDDTTPDAERLKHALALEAGVGAEHIILPLALIKTLPELLREEEYTIRCLLCRERSGGASEAPTCLRVVALYPAASTESPYALACDLGTTSVSLMLIDLVNERVLARASAGNVQISYGADVINRIVQQSKPGGVARLQKAIVEQTLEPLITAVCNSANVARTSIAHLTIAGNTTMNHLLLGVSANYLRMEPYVPCFGSFEGLTVADLGLKLSPTTPVYIAPNVGSYVGGDITAGVLACGLWQREELQLLVDLGTNGELVFGNNEFMMTCACSAGPAFEGGGIRSGMRATNGAIEAASIDPNTFEPKLHVIGSGKPAGICGSGLIDLISELSTTGALDGRGRFVANGKRFARDEHGTGSYVVAFAEETESGTAIVLDEVDLDNFIRAKGAIFSAICVMLDATGFEPADISRVYVAGGIGSGINIENAIAIGLFPDVTRERYQYLGNTSLIGARAMAQSSAVRTKVSELAQAMTYLELSSEPGYMDAFIAACFLPHTNKALFPSVK